MVLSSSLSSISFHVMWPWQSILPTKMTQMEAHQAKSIQILAGGRGERKNVF